MALLRESARLERVCRPPSEALPTATWHAKSPSRMSMYKEFVKAPADSIAVMQYKGLEHLMSMRTNPTFLQYVRGR